MSKKTFLKIIIVETFRMLAEIEALFSSPNDSICLRKAYLRSMNVKFGRKIWIGKNFRLFNQGEMILGERCSLGTGVRIENWSTIQIGNDFMAGPGLHLNSGGHDSGSLKPVISPIKIGNRVWCGIDVIITAGVTIGDDVVIGAGSVVIDDIPSGTLAAGVPAKVKKKLNRNEDLRLWTWAAD